MNVAAWAQRHVRSILFFLIALGLGGVLSIGSMPVGLFPPTTFPRVVVSVEAGDRPADRMEIEVTVPVEEALRSVPNLRRVRSTTSRGAAEISLDFAWGEDMIAASLQVEAALGRLSVSLPAGCLFDVRRMDPTVFPVIAYSLVSDTRSLVELRDIATLQLRPALSSIKGAANIAVLGGEQAEYQVLIEPDRLQAFGLSMQDVAEALGQANVVSAVGRVEDLHRLYLVHSDGQFQAPKEIENTIVRQDQGGLLRLRDLGQVIEGEAPQWTRVTADGHDAVLFQLYQQVGGNTVQIARSADAELQALAASLPSDVRIAKWYDQSELIRASANSVRDAILIGILLAAVVLLLFLRNVRITFVAIVSVPLVLAIVVLILRVRGDSFNIMTLGGMAAAVALVIDDAVVMIEHIIRRFHEVEGGVHDRVRHAAAEFTRPLVASSSATLIIFAPLAFLSGVTGAFFGALSITMATCLMASFLIAWLAVPLLSLRLLKLDQETQSQDATTKKADLYTKVLKGLFRVRFVAPLVLVALVATGVIASQRLGQGFMPAMDEGGFILDYVSEPGTSLEDTDAMVRIVEEILQATPEVETYSRRTGLQLGGSLTEANEGDFFIKLKPQPRRAVEQIMDSIREAVLARVPGLEIEMPQLMEDLIGDLTAVPQPIEIKLFADDEAQLTAVAEAVAAAIETDVAGVVDVKTGVVLAGDALIITVDRELAALNDLTVASVAEQLDALIAGVTPTQIQIGPKLVDIRLWTPSATRDRSAALMGLKVRNASGAFVPIERVAQIEAVRGQPQITREDLKRMIAVTGRISGRDMGSTVGDVIKRLDQGGLIPGGVTWRLGGLYQEQQAAMRSLSIVFAAAFALVATLLLFLYENFIVVFTMMLTVVGAAGAALIGLWLSGTELNITAMMGLTMVIGIVTEVLIFYYSEFEETEASAAFSARLITAGRSRMRPIAMTTVAAILAMLPLALGLGEGSEMLRPMAIAIVSGLLAQLPLAVIVFPALLSLWGVRLEAQP